MSVGEICFSVSAFQCLEVGTLIYHYFLCYLARMSVLIENKANVYSISVFVLLSVQNFKLFLSRFNTQIIVLVCIPAG